MIEIPSRHETTGIAHLGTQPIALAAGALVMIVLGVGAITLWRASTGTAPEQDRLVAVRQLQARTAQTAEQLVEKTNGLEVTQQEWIDQLQVVQDQVKTLRDQAQTLKRLLAAQHGDTKRVSEQISELAVAVEGLRQSLASARRAEASAPPAREKSIRTRPQAAKSAERKRAKARG
jgi:septal ring factor EnvC (AmiA/AmiB activator)